MKDNDKMTFNDKLAIFDQPNYRKSMNFEMDKKERKLKNSFEKKRQMFQPRKTIVTTSNQLSISINDTKKREKRENRYIKTEKENTNKVYKPNVSSAEHKKKEKKNDFSKSYKIYEPKENPKNKINEISVYTNNNNISVSEQIKLLNKNEEKNKMMKYSYNNKTTKGTIKSIEKVNPSNFNEIKINPKEEKEKKTNNNNYYKINNNKDINNNNNNNINNNYINKRKNNNNYIKEKKEIQNKPQNDKFNENLQIFNKNNNNQKTKEQKKNNNENRKKSNHYHYHHHNNFNDLVSIFSQNIDKNQEKKIPKKENHKKDEYFNLNLNINKELEKKEINNKKTNEINENPFIKKPLKSINKDKDLFNFNNKSFSEEIKKTSSPKAKVKTNIINDNTTEMKKLSKPMNQNDIAQKNIENKDEIKSIKKEVKAKNTRASKSLPKIKPKNEAKNDNIENENKYEILKLQPINPETKTNSFCKAFFIASFPKTSNQIVEDSEGAISDCGHEDCSSLPGFEPEIIYKYPEIDSKELEINNMLASICFPNSIKVCYSNEEDKISSVKNYSCCFTNQVGDRYYGMTYHFYVRLSNSDFCSNYNTNFFEKITSKYSGEIDENLDSKTKIINDINSRKYVYIPYCMCLVSKYTYFAQMEKSLESILITLKNGKIKSNELNEIISYLVKSISSPYINTIISFTAPNINEMIELRPCYYQEMSLYGNNLILLLEKLSVNHIFLLFRLLLLEQKILLISSDYDNLTQVSSCLISLLYPLTWIHIYIPIITEKMLKYLQSFLPFINGMHKSLFEQEKVQKILKTSHKDLFIFDIDKNRFEIIDNLIGKKRVNPIKFLNKHVPSFPRKLEDLIIQQLNILKIYYKKNAINKSNYVSINIKMKLLFIQVFVEMLYDYKKYMAIIDDLPVFNTNDFLKERPEADKNFYKEITTTQLYQIFIQNSLHYMNNKNKNYYFDELIVIYLNKKGKEDNNNNFIILDNQLETDMNNKLFKINKTYVIKPSRLKLFRPIENEINDLDDQNLLEDINVVLKKEFKYPQILNEKGIVKQNRRIIYNDIDISNKNDINSFGYCMTKEEKKDNEMNKALGAETKKENDEDNRDKVDKNLEKKLFDPDDESNSELTEIQKEDIRDNIRGTLTRVFKSEKLNLTKDSAVLSSSLESQYGKNYFVNVIEGNKSSKEIKIISEESFMILFKVITKCLLKLESNKKNMIFVMKLIKSCSFFKAIVSKIDYFLDKKIFETLTKNYNIFNEVLFWELWIEDELNENDTKILNKFKKINEEKDTYHFIDDEDEEIARFKNEYKEQLKKARQNMIKMKLNKSLMISVVVALSDKYIIDDEFKKNLLIEIRDNKLI